MTTEPKNHNFNALLEQSTYELMKRIADHEKCSLAAVVRNAVTARGKMLFDNKPCCADGRPCLVAGMHGLAATQNAAADVGLVKSA